jgi:hypothetical protein
MDAVGDLPPNASAERRGNGVAASGPPPRHNRTRRGDRTRAGKVRLLTLDALDQRCAATQAARQLIGSLTISLGGDEALSAGEQQLIERAALLTAVIRDYEIRWLSREPVPMSDYLAAVNTLRRVLVSLGLRKRVRDVTPSVAAYLREAAE